MGIGARSSELRTPCLAMRDLSSAQSHLVRVRARFRVRRVRVRVRRVRVRVRRVRVRVGRVRVRVRVGRVRVGV